MSKQKGSALIVVLVVLIVISLIVIGTVMFLSYNPGKNLARIDSQPKQDITDSGVVASAEQADTVPPVVSDAVSTVAKNPNVTSGAITNCSDMSCFLLAAKTCIPAQGIVAYDNLPILNFLFSGKTEIQIKKGNNGMCVYYQKYLEASVKYSDKMIQSLLGQGKTLDEIKSLEKMGNQSQQFAIGKESTCTLTIDSLIEKISENMDGNLHFSSEHPGCTGTLYDRITQ